MELEPVIGLEIHVQLKTKSKIFCSCDNTGELKPPNSTVCPICLGHPGTLPAANLEAVKIGIKTALALNLKVANHSKFDRKNYFYPDLPKGYQISQYDEPLARDGYLEIKTGKDKKIIGIERLHLEEDTGKLLHTENQTLVDFNRAGTPLMEIVTRPEVMEPAEAKIFLQDLRSMLRYLQVSDADMEKGHLRVDVNISLRPQGEKKLYPKTELKNLNSFRSVERGLQYEIKRLTDLWNKDQAPTTTTTRGWDETKGVSQEQRVKEVVHDYRYFPEPDLLPLTFSDQEIKIIKQELAELPKEKLARLVKEYGLSTPNAKVLVSDIGIVDFFEKVVSDLLGRGEEIDKKQAAKLTANWMINKLFQLLNENNLSLEQMKFNVSQLADFLMLVSAHRINSTNAQLILSRMVATGSDPEQILTEEDLGQDNVDVSAVIEKVVSNYPEQVKQFLGGKEPVIKFLLGAVMKEAKGKVNPMTAEDWLRNYLKQKN